jgi:hypothetical protein
LARRRRLEELLWFVPFVYSLSQQTPYSFFVIFFIVQHPRRARKTKRAQRSPAKADPVQVVSLHYNFAEEAVETADLQALVVAMACCSTRTKSQPPTPPRDGKFLTMNTEEAYNIPVATTEIEITSRKETAEGRLGTGTTTVETGREKETRIATNLVITTTMIVEIENEAEIETEIERVAAMSNARITQRIGAENPAEMKARTEKEVAIDKIV